MLVLSRKINEVIVINDNITVTIIDIRGGKVRLGIEAPQEVRVYRLEVYNAIKAGLAGDVPKKDDDQDHICNGDPPF